MGGGAAPTASPAAAPAAFPGTTPGQPQEQTKNTDNPGATVGWGRDGGGPFESMWPLQGKENASPSRSFASPARTTRTETETDFPVGVTAVPTPQPPMMMILMMLMMLMMTLVVMIVMMIVMIISGESDWYEC